MKLLALFQPDSYQALTVVGLVIALGAASSPAAATSLLSGFGAPIYVEDYQGESVYPTSPEIDTLGIGGLQSFVLGNSPLPAAATLTGTSARVDMSTSATGAEIFQGVGLTNATPSSLGSNLDLALHIEVDSLDLSSIGLSLAVFGAGLLSASGVNLFASLSSNLGAANMLLVLGEETDTESTSTFVSLSTSATAAILAGAAFEIDLVLDRQAGTIQAAIATNGEEFSVPALALTQLGTQPIALIAHTALIANSFGDDDAVSVDFTRMQLHAVPEPGTALLVGLSLVAMTRKRRVR